MSVDRYTLDTNILVYSVDLDAKQKRVKAIEVIENMIEQDCILPMQALSEFYSVATRKQKMPHEDARELVNDWMTLFPVVSAEPSTLKRAMLAVEQHKMSFWNSLMLETSVQAGVTKFLSEDLQHGRVWKTATILNPFLSTET